MSSRLGKRVVMGCGFDGKVFFYNNALFLLFCFFSLLYRTKQNFYINTFVLGEQTGQKWEEKGSLIVEGE
jgi:hypothetical protein